MALDPFDAMPTGRFMISSTLARGLYTEIDGRLFYTFTSSGRWWLRSWDAADQAIGFRRSSPGAVYDRPVDGDDVARVLHVSYHGVYRGLRVGVSRVGLPTIWVFASTTERDEARERGMVEDGRDGWKKEVASDDPDLTVVQTVDEIPPPWLT